MKGTSIVSRNRSENSSVQDSDSATSSEIGDFAEVDDSDFLEFLGDWSESIMFEGVADDIEYGESSGSRLKDESVSSKRRRLEAFNTTKRLTSNALLMKISNDESPTSARVQLRKALKSALQSSVVSCPEVLLRSPEELKLERIPGYLYQAFNGGNLKLVSHIVNTSFATDCTFQTMIMDAPLVGRQVGRNPLNFTISPSLQLKDCISDKCCAVNYTGLSYSYSDSLKTPHLQPPSTLITIVLQSITICIVNNNNKIPK